MNPIYDRHRIALICLGLALVTAGLYWPVTHHDFINVDDPRFVTENQQVQAGFTWSGICWALQSVYTESWQPMTWFSHMLDCQLYGVKPGPHHVTSLLLHLANTLLLFLWLNQLTNATWRSAFVAAFFAWHPLHVESVAWICERKDVLSAFFWLLALLAYNRYVRQPRAGAYLLVLGLFTLGLMSKPMVITLPCVLLLLDFWPFNRLGLQFLPGTETFHQSGCRPHPLLANWCDKTVVGRAVSLVGEKIPFFLLALAMSAATVFAQKAGGSLASMGSLPFPLRVANALASYLSYLTKMFWPSGLAYFYPYTFGIPLASVLVAALLLTLWTAWFGLRVRSQPCLLVGWLWFLGTLFPTIGLVQFCLQARADRYTYIPSIGLFMVVVWGLHDLFERWPARRKLLPVLGGLALAACLATSSVQLACWKNSLTVSRHAIEVTDNNYVAYESLGEAITALGQPERAVGFFAEAVRLAPGWAQGQFNYGITLGMVGQTNGAIEHLQAGVKLVPDFAQGRYDLGQTLLQCGRTDEAIRQFAEVVRLDPFSSDAQRNWGVALAAQHKPDEAIPHFSAALRQRPDDPRIRFALGIAFLDTRRPDLAAPQFAAVLKLTPADARAHFQLARALEQQGKLAEAVGHYREAWQRTPGFPEAKAALDRILATNPDLKVK